MKRPDWVVDLWEVTLVLAVLLFGFWLMQGGGYIPGFGRVE
jgi:hypothetical protein